MFALKTYEPTTDLQPFNPDQVIRATWTPRGYTAHGWNPVKTTAALEGATLSSTWAGLPTWAQFLLVAGSAAAVGYAGMMKFGDSHVRPALKRIGLAGARRGGGRSRRPFAGSLFGTRSGEYRYKPGLVLLDKHDDIVGKATREQAAEFRRDGKIRVGSGWGSVAKLDRYGNAEII